MPGAGVRRLLFAAAPGSLRGELPAAAVGARAAGQGAVPAEEDHGRDGDEDQLSEADARRQGREHPEAAGDASGPGPGSGAVGSGAENGRRNHGGAGDGRTAGERACEGGGFSFSVRLTPCLYLFRLSFLCVVCVSSVSVLCGAAESSSAGLTNASD